ncbi:MAG: RHS repeat-associated core domain-containing protein, partial [Micrococcales bacterium]|nr:RHS repeat-associated core domain-containing protein [Micrococcales bacterium]
FVYDYSDQRRVKTGGGETVLYVSDAFELRDTEATKWLTVGTERLLRVTTEAAATEVSFYLQDHLGTSAIVLDGEDSEPRVASTSLPYGATEAEVTSDPGFEAEYEFTGKERDEETGLDYFGARYYAARLGRWVSPDPVAIHCPESVLDTGMMPLSYAYVRDNPIRLVDPDGNNPVEDWRTRPVDVPVDAQPEYDDQGQVHHYAYQGDDGRLTIFRPDGTVLDSVLNEETVQLGDLIGVGGAGRAGLRAAGGRFVQNRTLAAVGRWVKRQVSNALRLVRRPARTAARGAPRLLSQFTGTTVDAVVASAGRLRPGGQIAEGARAIAKKLGHAQSGGYTSAFAGVRPTQANAEAIIRNTLQNPARTFYGDTTIDVYNAAGQGVRFDRATNAFKGFLEAGQATR